MSFWVNAIFLACTKLSAALVVTHSIQKRHCGICAAAAFACYALSSVVCYRFVLQSASLCIWLLTELLSILFMSLFICTVVKCGLWANLYLSNWILTFSQFVFSIALLAESGGPSGSINIFTSLPVYLLFYTLFAVFISKRLTTDGNLNINRKQCLITFLTTSPVNLFNHVMFVRNNFDTSNSMLIFSTVFAYGCCLFALYLQRILTLQASLSNELSVVEQLWQQSHLQYEISSSNLDHINRTIHDMMHKLSKLYNMNDAEERRDYLDSLSYSFVLYDAFLQTGNKALDTILTEKNLYCKNQHISFKCVADGSRLSFMDTTDIYTIFNSAIDNAITYALQLEDFEKRLLSVRVSATGNLLSISIENFYEPNASPVIYGYGLKSILYAINKYDGSLHVSTSDNLFTVNIIIPMEVSNGVPH